MFKRKSKEIEDGTENKKASVFLKVGVVVFILVFVLILIPEEWFEKKTQELENKNVSSEIDTYEQQGVLEIIEQSSDGAVKFNTVFGGTDYKAEYDAFWAENELDGHTLLEEHLSATDLSTLFDELSSVSVVTDDTIVEEVYPENPFTLDMLETADYIKFSSMADRVCIGVIQDYYVVSWIRGTAFVFVEDYRNRFFDEYYFARQMLHFGKSVTTGFDANNIRIESFDRFNVVYVGGK